MVRTRALPTVIAAVISVSLFASPALAGNCRDNLQISNQSRNSHVNFLQAIKNGVQRDLRELQKSAMILEMMGDESACLKVVEAARRLLTEGQRRADRPHVKAVPASIAPAKKPSAPLQLRRPASVLIGSNLLDRTVHGVGGSKLGDVRDIVVSPDNSCSSAILVAHGGVLGFGEKLVLLPTEAIREDAAGRIVIDELTADAIKRMPAYQSGDWPLMQIESWQAGLCGVKEQSADLRLDSTASSSADPDSEPAIAVY